MFETNGPVRERFDVVVIGGGQAGLSVGYHLKKQGLRFVILDGESRIGDAWRKRWDSLRLFSPARFDSLDGLPFPAHPDHFPTKDEMADYLEAYAARFELPVRSRTRVLRVSRAGGEYLLETSSGALVATQVVVAMSSYQTPKVPDFARELSTNVVQIHASEYRSPAQLVPGRVLVVGAGNSGAEIGIELARSGHRTWLAGRDVGAMPFEPTSRLALRVLLPFMFRVVFHRILSLATPMGRKVRAKPGPHTTPLIRTKPKQLVAAGVERVAKVSGVKDGKLLLEDGRVLEVENVIWSNGYDPSHGFIDLPIFDESGNVRHDAGVAHDEPGLYFVGLHFLYSMSSAMIHGVGRDAERIVRVVAERARVASRNRLALRPGPRAALALPSP